MFKGHQFQNVKNPVKTKESMSQKLGIKRDWERYHVLSFCFMYEETEARESLEPRWATWHRPSQEAGEGLWGLTLHPSSWVKGS